MCDDANLQCSPHALDGLGRGENTFLHEDMPLSSTFPDQDIPNLKVKEQRAMLVFISIGHYEHLLQDNTIASEHLKILLYHVCKELLHPKGTAILSLPVPYYKHAGRIVGEFASICPLLLCLAPLLLLRNDREYFD